jgi:DNA-binding LacI/PurR family transcriptional regulator
VVPAGARVCGPEGLGIALRRLPLQAPARELQALARDRTVAGVVLVNTTAELLASVPPALRGRVVSIGAGSVEVPAFDVDAAGAAAATVAHLLGSGRRRIAMVAGPPWLPCAERPVAAFRAAVAAAGLPVRTVAGDSDARAGEAGAEEVLTRWPDTDAIVASCDDAPVGADRRRGGPRRARSRPGGGDGLPLRAGGPPQRLTVSRAAGTPAGTAGA